MPPKDYADMTETELAQVKGRFRAGDEEQEYNTLLDAINRVEEIANYHQLEVWVHEWNEADGQWRDIWEVDSRRVDPLPQLGKSKEYPAMWFIEWLRSWRQPVIPNVVWCERCQAHHAPPACSE